MKMEIKIFFFFFLFASDIKVRASCELGDEVDDGKSLRCQLNTLQQGTDDVSDADVDKANKLELRCSDFSFSESRLKSQHFGDLPFLRELDIKFCKVRHLPGRAFAGLSNLQKLTLQSHNSEWSSVQMEVDAHSLHHLDSLELLDLSHNNLWSLPAGVLCDLAKLKAVNVSNNHLMAAADLGLSFADGCRVNLRSLDLSHNVISAFDSNEVVQVTATLASLNLAHNRLTTLDKEALKGFESLLHLDVSSNELSSLEVGVFAAQQHLERLFLQNNSLSLLPEGLFSDLGSLTVLNLSRNAISSHLLSAQTFSGLTSLQALDLSRNKIAKVDKDTFSAMEKLQILVLRHNKIRTIDADSFAAQSLLKVLALSHNGVEITAENAFNGLISLESLSLDHNRISAVNVSGESVKNLKDLALNNNMLTFVPEFIGKAGRLRTLDLGNNAISKIDSDSFANLTDLYGLRLAQNRLHRVANETFVNCPNIHVLNLAHNFISSVDQFAFNPLQELRALRLDNNKLEDLNGLVSSLANLQWLNVSSNELQWFDYAFVPSSLEWLDVSANKLAELGNFYELDNFGLRSLDASGNSIRGLNSKSFPGSLAKIALKENLIEKVEPLTFAHLGKLAEVDLSDNKISSLLQDALRVSSAKGSLQRPDFSLIGNPLKCDCQMEWLQDINAQDASSFANVIDLAELECMAEDGTSTLLTATEKESFLCSYSAHCSKDCVCCDFYACDCRFQCPDGCSCFHDRFWTKNVVQCSSRQHRQIPLLLPLDATEVRLDGNDLQGALVDTQSFLGRNNVRHLYLNGSEIVTLGNGTFSGLTGLEALHLENNELTELRGEEFSSLTFLRELFLHNNHLVYINEVTFEPLLNLRSLTLDGNRLTVFPAWRLLHNRHLAALTLARNTWSCGCDFIQPFNFFLEKKSALISDYDVIQCVSDDIIDASLRCKGSKNVISSSSLSKSEEGKNVSKEDSMVDVASIIVPVTAVLVVLILGFLAVFVFRAKIKAWLYKQSSDIYESRNGNSTSSTSSSTCCNPSSRNNQLFDVYVSYAVKDADFVEKSLTAALEQGQAANNYKLCLHQRDFPATAPIYDTVSVAAESSKRIILVLSRAYLDCEWPHVQLPLRNSLLKSRDDAGGKLILLFIEDLSDQELSSHPELAQHMQVCPTIRWGSAGFVNKLRFFLPESAFLTFQRNITLRNQERLYPQLLTSQQPHLLQDRPPPPPPPPTYKTLEGFLHLQHQPNPILYGEHTYHSIPDNHIYHTLEPNFSAMQQKQQQQQHQQQYRLNNMSMIVSSSSAAASPHHSHTHSTSSAAQLLPNSANSVSAKAVDGSYVV